MKIKREKPKRSLPRRLVLAVDALMNHILLILTALVFLFGFYALWDANQVYSQASSSEYEAYRPVSTSEKDELLVFLAFTSYSKSIQRFSVGSMSMAPISTIP